MSSNFVGVLEDSSGSLMASSIRFRRAQGRNPLSLFDATGWVFNENDHVIPGRYEGPKFVRLFLSSADGKFLGLLGSHSSSTDLGVATTSIRYQAVPHLEGLGAWLLNPGDRFVAGDLDADKQDEIVVSNGDVKYLGALEVDNELIFTPSIQRDMVPFANGASGWILNPGDQFYTADLDDDDRAEVLVVSSDGHYLGVLEWDDLFVTLSIRKGQVPFADGASGWILNPGDRFFTADLDNDGKAEILVASGDGDYLGVLELNGGMLTTLSIRKGAVPFEDGTSGWVLNNADRFFTAQMIPDLPGRWEIFVANAAGTHVGILAFDGNLVARSIRSQSVPALTNSSDSDWVLNPEDYFFPVDLDGNGFHEVVVVNDSGEYIGVLDVLGFDIMTRSILKDIVPGTVGSNGWRLNEGDRFSVADLDGDGREKLFVRSEAGDYPYISLAIRVNTNTSPLTVNFINTSVRLLATLVLPRDIHVEIASRGNLNLPTLFTPWVGDCLLTTAEQDLVALYTMRQGMGSTDIGVFYVDSLVPPSNLCGCGGQLPFPLNVLYPGCAIGAVTGTGAACGNQILAHEIGHVLGLTHDTASSTNDIMFDTPVGAPLPFSPDQAETMKESSVMSY